MWPKYFDLDAANAHEIAKEVGNAVPKWRSEAHCTLSPKTKSNEWPPHLSSKI
jgi:hypothetical protein